jgi:UDP-sulfoquinovose synthase
MKICILGADGYYGYPLFLRLSQNHEVKGLDNFWRRSLTEYPSLIPLHDKEKIEYCDVCDFDKLFLKLKKFQPDYVIHLAEQRSAPYSMKGVSEKQFTIKNNTLSSLNVMECARILQFKTIHIGSMGVYGYDKNEDIKEGDSVRAPGSIYHLSKCLDNSIFEFYSRVYNCHVIELHQGIIWGIGGRFDYDETFGTIINRFLVQKIINHPLTIYGSGNQQRAVINIENSLDCVELVITENLQGFNTFNQYTDIVKLKDIADMISSIQNNLLNPRIENENNVLISTNGKLKKLGLQPIALNKENLNIISNKIVNYKNNIDLNLIYPKTLW